MDTIALKDWAVTIEALGKGTQIILMRKGGIREETRHFQVKNDSFYLYPAYEHQKGELLKPQYQKEIIKTLQEWSSNKQRVWIKYFACLYEDIEVMEEEALYRLNSHHIWTNTFAFQRLNWKKKCPLHLLLVRVYQLSQPREVFICKEYLGCKSWLALSKEFNPSAMTPVLNDQAFESEVNKIKERLYDK